MTQPPGKEALIYVHLPKAGGTTLNRVIEAEYPVSRIYCIDPAYHAWANRRLAKAPDASLRGYDVFIGHMPYGLHARLDRPARYITVFRSPVPRMISAYRFARNYSLHPRRKLARSTTILGFLDRLKRHNVQTGLLAGQKFDEPVTEQSYERAVRNLETHFAVGGLTERFDDTLALLMLRFGWKIERLGDFNVTAKDKGTREPISEADKRQIAEWNSLDVRLFDLATKRFEREIGENRAAIDANLAAIARAKDRARAEATSYYTGATLRKTAIRLRSLLV
jgi:hypothetical protein